jgi:hypothetical protein
MNSNYFDSMILGITNIGQGIAIAVEGTHRSLLRVLVAKFARRLRLRLRGWCAFSIKSMPTAGMTPAMATCPSYSATRRQRHERWMSGVVVDPGTVGVSR